MSQETWLGIDPGIAIIGWAVLQNDGTKLPLIIDYGTIETNKQLSTPQRLLEIKQDLKELLTEFNPQGIAIEMPFFNRTIKAAGGVMQALGVINLVCYQHSQIEPIFLHQASWKCHLGDGKANKKEVAQMITTLFNLEQLPIDDSVDAIAIAYAGLCGLRNNI
ncbi:MAG: crossover junction endodeoxyribonuclease RuvC [Crocosphaera sp.]|nr:crossover junction endodeoxyribonuclease RuvC [Crocosphaera sp.]